MPLFPSIFEITTLDGTNGFTVNGKDEQDQSGYVVSEAGDINGDGIDDLAIGALGGNGRTGESYVVFGSSSTFSSTVNLSDLNGSNGFTVSGVGPDNQFNVSLSSAGDFNGDGIDDLIVGAEESSPNGMVRAGESYLIFGSSNAFGSNLAVSSLDGSNGFLLTGTANNDNAGSAVSSAGDFNNDGFDDLIIGAPVASPNGIAASGKSHIVFGTSVPFTSSTFNLATLNGSNGLTINGIGFIDFSGTSVSGVGDINEDNIDDVVIGAKGSTSSGDMNIGESYIVYGSTSLFNSSFELSDLDGTNGFTIRGVEDSDSFGQSVSGAGDFNGDGLNDLIIGAPYADNPGGFTHGEGYVVFGTTAANSLLEISTLDGTNGFTLKATDKETYTGRVVSNAGDINHDGLDDIIITAPYAEPNGLQSAGESYVLYGSSTPSASSIDLTSLDGSNGFSIEGNTSYLYLGQSASGAGDINHDGIDDFVVGAHYGSSANGNLHAGNSYVVFGQSNHSTSGDDIIDVLPVDSTIDAGEGNDVIRSSIGNDNLTGGTGNDRVYGNDGSDLLFGNDGDDNLHGGNDADTLEGGLGNDILDGGADDDTVYGNEGNDVVLGFSGNDILYGNAGSDVIFGHAGSDGLFGGDNNDRLYGGDGNDGLEGDDGDDTLRGEGGADMLDGGLGNDWLDGGAGNDTLDGGLGDDTLLGFNDNDNLTGGEGSDALYGHNGLDTLRGGNDDDRLYGGDQQDLLYGDSGNDVVDGGLGDDSLVGGLGDDILLGYDGNDIVSGGAGNDLLFGHLGNDILAGFEDNDRLYGDLGDDTLQGDEGEDKLYGGDGADSLAGGQDNDILDGGAGDDSLYGNEGDDVMLGGDGSDFMFGNSGDDAMFGHDDADVMYGGSGNDRLYGGAGDDVLGGGMPGRTNEGPQIDSLYGGAGSDIYVVAGYYSELGDEDYAVIKDFNKAEDRIFIGSETHTLATTGGFLPSGTGIYNNSNLIAVIEGYVVGSLNISESYFMTE